MADFSPSSVPAAPRFLDQVRQVAFEHYNRHEPADRCVDWARRFILFHNKRHPAEMGCMEIGAFLEEIQAAAVATRALESMV
jgi:hypothetical protein